VAQYSEAHDRLKLGIRTSSNFHKIVTPQGKPSKQWREYACLLFAERVLQHRIDFYNSPAIEQGLIVEADAVDWYEFDQDVAAQKVGFITDNDHTMGCSPDRLVGEDGLLEIKAPLPHTQVEYWISGEVSERFRPQLQAALKAPFRSAQSPGDLRAGSANHRGDRMIPLEYRHVTKCQGRGRPPQGERALTGAEHQARYRQRQVAAASAHSVHPRRRRTRPQRWRAAIAELLALQAEYAVWLEALPEPLRDGATGEALQAIVELDLDELITIEPPRGFGRD
jgi:YqaJ-like viral recombinase domain